MTVGKFLVILIAFSMLLAFLGGYLVWENGGSLGRSLAGYLACVILVLCFALGDQIASRIFGI